MDVYRTALHLMDAGKPAALGIVLRTLGATPQKAGAKALFEPTGQVHGTLGGGCLEAEAQQRALLALNSGAPGYFTLNLDEVAGRDDELICGGRATILTAPMQSSNHTAYAAAAQAEENGGGTLVTVVAHPAYPMGLAIWIPKGTRPPAGISEEELNAAEKREKPLLVSDDAHVARASVAFFVEPVCPPPKLIVVGAGNIGKALSHFASRVGFRVTVLDDRPAFANAVNLPDAHEVRCGDIESILMDLPMEPRDFVVIVTRGHRLDSAALTACIHRELAYLGLIGSRRKALLLRKRLREEGRATEEEIARVVSPIGLNLGGATVDEIALSIAAQLVSVRRRKALEARPLAYFRPARSAEIPHV